MANNYTQPIVSELLTQQFYGWELEGRGWVHYGFPLTPEPPFRSFQYQYPEIPTGDDGRQHTLISGLLERFSRTSPPSVPAQAKEDTDKETEYESLPSFTGNLEPPVVYSLLVPQDYRVSRSVLEHLLINLSSAAYPFSFEYVGGNGILGCQITCQPKDTVLLTTQFRTHLPGIILQNSGTLPRNNPIVEGDTPIAIVEYGLFQEFMRPLQCFQNLDNDPLLGIISILDSLQNNELGMYQVLWKPCANPWGQSILRSVTDSKGGSFFLDAPDMLSLAREKISLPLFAAVIRLAAYAPDQERTIEILESMDGALRLFDRPTSNSLFPLPNTAYAEHSHKEFTHADDLYFRRCQRTGMILNLNEIIGFVHPPGINVVTEKLERDTRRTKAAPPPSKEADIVLGINIHAGQQTEVALNSEERIKHMYVIGASGTGKSTFLQNLISQDLSAGNGFAVLDPHGDLIDDILLHIPEQRLDDVIVFDPADADYPIGCNILAAHSDLEQNLLASDLVAVFRRLATSWGDQMDTVFANAILAFLESSRGGTLSDLRRFLVEKEYRDAFLKTVQDDNIIYYWKREYPLITGRPQTPILTRLDAFLRSKLVRNIVSQRENRLDFAGIMNQGKVFLARLAQGAIGEENAYLLGSLLVSKLHQAALSRQEIAESQRRPFYLYIDEFHHFLTPSMASILTGVRKFRMGLILAHQELRQLEKRDSEVAHAVLANPYTRVSFRVSESDARKLSEGYSAFDANDFLNLGTGEALARFERARQDFNLLTYPPPEYDATDIQCREAIIEASRSRYARPRAEVEEEFAQSMAIIRQKEPDTSKEAPEKQPPKPQPVKAKETETASITPQPAVEDSQSDKPTELPEKKPETTKSPKTLKPTTIGKGGHEHRSIQRLIKRWAEGMGYKSSIEKQLDSGGSVDVALEKDDIRIACEISVTTTPEHEFQNIQKCLDENFTHIVAVGQDRKKIEEIRKLAQKQLPKKALTKIHFFEVQELFMFVQELEAQNASHEITVRGYRVQVNYKSVSEEEQHAARNILNKTIVESKKQENNK